MILIRTFVLPSSVPVSAQLDWVSLILTLCTYAAQPPAYAAQPIAYSAQPTAYAAQTTPYAAQPTAYAAQPKYSCESLFGHFQT